MAIMSCSRRVTTDMEGRVLTTRRAWSANATLPRDHMSGLPIPP